MKRSNLFKIGLVLNVIPFIIGAIYYNKLPEVMATHFGFNNEANGFSSKPMALFGVPLLLIAAYVFAYFFTNKDPKRANQNEKAVGVVFMVVPILNIILTTVVVYINLGYKVNISFIMNIFLGLLFIVLGNYMPKVKRNYTVGIKLPWTLDSDYVWNKTHYLAGYIWVISGVLFIISSFVFKNAFAYVFPVIILFMVGIPGVYSYLVYKSLNKNQP